MNRVLSALLGSFAVVAGLYVGSYYAMVERPPLRRPDGMFILFIRGIWPKYTFGGEAAATIFTPIHNIDRQIRYDFWHGD